MHGSNVKLKQNQKKDKHKIEERVCTFILDIKALTKSLFMSPWRMSEYCGLYNH